MAQPVPTAGSSLLPNYPQQGQNSTPVNIPTYSYENLMGNPNVLGASTTATTQNNAPAVSKLTSLITPTKTGTTGGNGAVIPPPPAPIDNSQIDAAYNPLLNYLNQAQSQLGADQGSYISDINNTADNSRTSLTNGYNSTQQTLQNQQAQGARQKQDVITAAQRLYQELTQGNLQRFGGASSAGQAASELQGRELQRNTGAAQQQYGDLVQQLGQKKLEVDNNYQLGLKQIDDQKTAAVNEIQRSFQDKLSQINSQRAQTESAKAQQRLSALQQYRDQVYQVQVQNAQMRAQLDQFKASAGNQLQEWEKQLAGVNQAGANALGGFNQNVAANATNFSNIQPGVAQSSATPLYQGQIQQRDQKDKIGDYYNPSTQLYAGQA